MPLKVTYQGCATAGLVLPANHEDSQRSAAIRRRAARVPSAGSTLPPRRPAASAPRSAAPPHGGNRRRRLRLRAGPAGHPDPRRQPARGARHLLRHRPAALAHALRAADDPDPLGHHRRPRREGDRRARLLARVHLRAGNGADLRRRRRRLRARLQAGAAGLLPAALDHHAVRRAVRRAGVRHVRRLHAADAQRHCRRA